MVLEEIVNDNDPKFWNFVLTGEVRCGAGVVLTSINNRVGAICHADLFHPLKATRQVAHEAYYGPSSEPVRIPEYYVEGVTSPWQYINHTILTTAKNGESAVGFHILYEMMRKLELYDLFEHKEREGGFGVIHVTRNPVACFISLKQAQSSGVWTRGWNTAAQAKVPSPVRLNAEELTVFCREHGATESKIRAACCDKLDIPYRDLVLNYQATMARVFDFIELPAIPVLATPGCKRLKNRPIRDRVANWAEVKLDVPTDIKRLIDSEDLF